MHLPVYSYVLSAVNVVILVAMTYLVYRVAKFFLKK